MTSVLPIPGEPVLLEQDPNLPQFQPEKPTGALKQVPETFDLQQVLGFRFFIKRLPTVNFFVNQVNIPGISLPSADEATPFLVLPQPGDHPQYETLVLNFKVDQGMENYFALVKWMLTISGLLGRRAYTKLAVKPEYTGEGVKSEILVSILNAQKNLIRSITYHDAWPTQVKLDRALDSTLESVEYLNCTAIFKYSFYESSTDV